MNRLRDLPIKQKLTWIILLTCAAVLLLAFGVLATHQAYDFRRTMLRDSTVLADVLAKNTQAALAFLDENAARETLLALQAEPYVSAACVYQADGTRFAEYARADSPAEFPVRPLAESRLFENGHLTLFRPIRLNNKVIGTLYMQSDLKGMYDRLWLFAGTSVLVLIGSGLVAWVLSSRLQRPISEPILALAKIAQVVAERKDYTVRATTQGEHEIGLLTSAFNQMLAGTEERDKALRAANEALRGEIVERKGAEDRVQSQLARLELLNRITRAISDRQDLPSIFQVVIRALEEQLPIDFTCVCLYEPATEELVVTNVGHGGNSLGPQLALVPQARLNIAKDGLAKCVSGILVHEPDTGQSGLAFTQRLATAGLGSLVAAPLMAESRVFGVLIAARRQKQSFSSGECEFLQQLSGHVALAAHQAQLYVALQQAYDDLRQSQQAVMQQERLRALGQMASGIAHDINNAISPVALYTESLLENEKDLSPRARDYLGTIQHAIEDVAETVARMREFYRPREAQMNLRPVQLNDLAQQVIDLSRARWSDMPQQRGVVVKMATELAADLPVVMGVESEIREALINLIFNAVDAMPGGGTLTLRTRRQPGKGGTASVVHFEVCDTGLGMSEDTRRRCLEPFFTTKGERGTGLGLAMVYGIAQRHGAEIEIDSVLGRGTTLRLVFPIPAGQTTITGQVVVASRVPTRVRILVVDDDPTLIKSLQDTLETDGHLVVTAGDGQAGVETFRKALAAEEPFAVVITDLGMPNMDGRQVATAVKEMSPATPVIMLTGWGQRMVAEGDIPSHVDRVLNKPPKLRELREALAQFVGSAKT